MTIGFAALWSAGLAKRYGSVQAIALKEGLSTTFVVSLAVVPNAAVAGSLYIVRAAPTMTSPISDFYQMSITAPEDRGVASAVNSIVWRLPNSVATVAGGSLLAASQFELPFFSVASFYVTHTGAFYFTFRDVRPEGGEPTRSRAKGSASNLPCGRVQSGPR